MESSNFQSLPTGRLLEIPGIYRVKILRHFCERRTHKLSVKLKFTYSNIFFVVLLPKSSEARASTRNPPGDYNSSFYGPALTVKLTNPTS